MPPLSNPRWERFAQRLFEGLSADEAYVKAGYSENRGNASRLKANESVSMRVAELQAEIAKENVVSVGSLLAELESARQKATSLDQLSAVVRAIEAKAKVSGLLTQKIEVTNGGNVFDDCESTTDVADAIARSGGVELSADELMAFTKLVTEWHDAMRQFLASCRAKVVQPAMSQSQRLSHERKRLGLRPVNASQP
jgi:phage terminase small subunit